MFKIKEKIQFSKEDNRMQSIANTKVARETYYSNKYNNVKFLLSKRFGWMNKFIKELDNGIEVGSGAGFSKDFIKNKNFKLTDLGNDEHLDYKNIDAQNTGFKNNDLDFVIASNMIHHIPYPIKFFQETNRILKKGGKLIIQEAYCSLILQLVIILMKHEGFDFTVNPWNKDKPVTEENNVWMGNVAVTNLIFDNPEIFEKEIGNLYKIEHEKICECFIFLNSGGVHSTTFYIPLNSLFLKILDKFDSFLAKFFPKIFATGRQIVLTKV